MKSRRVRAGLQRVQILAEMSLTGRLVGWVCEMDEMTSLNAEQQLNRSVDEGQDAKLCSKKLSP